MTYYIPLSGEAAGVPVSSDELDLFQDNWVIADGRWLDGSVYPKAYERIKLYESVLKRTWFSRILRQLFVWFDTPVIKLPDAKKDDELTILLSLATVTVNQKESI